MKTLLAVFILLVVTSVFGANIPYTALNTNQFFTNNNYVSIRVDTNSILTNATGLTVNTNVNSTVYNLTTNLIQNTSSPQVWTNDGTFIYPSGTGPNHPDGSAPSPPLVIRKDGSVFYGTNVAQDVNESDFTKKFPFYSVSMTSSNEPSFVQIVNGVIDSENYLFEAYRQTDINGDKDTSYIHDFWTVSFTNGTLHEVDVRLDLAGPQFTMLKNGTDVFAVDTDGNARAIRAVQYSWPSTNAAPGQFLTSDGGSPQQLYWSTVTAGAGGVVTNFATTNTDTGLTNAIKSIAGSGIGPGTVNQVAKFTSTTNVGDSIVSEPATNMWQWRSRVAGTPWTNGITNRIFGEYTSESNYLALDIVSAVGVNSEFEVHGVQGASRSAGIPMMNINGSLLVEPDANATSGHTAHNVYPNGNGVGLLGTTSERWHGVYSDTQGFIASDITALSGSHNFQSASAGIGMSTAGIEFDTIADGFLGGAQRDANGLRGFVVASAGTGVYAFGVGGFAQDTFMTRGTAASTVSFSTNNSAASQPVTAIIEGGEGTGVNHPGSDVTLLGGLSTGSTNSGAVMLATAQSTTSGSSKNVAWLRSAIVGEPVNLTESSATLVCTVSNITAGHFAGIKVSATTDADDATDFQAVTEDFRVSAVNKGGTVSTTISASAPMATVQSSGTLTTTWTAVANNNGIDIKNNAVSSLTQTTLRTRYRIEVDSDVKPVVYDVQKLIHQ